MDPTKLRAWWFHRQGLDGRLRGASTAAVLAETGWARSVGGIGPYLTLFARNRASRESVDAAMADLEIHELPSVRGCTYVLPADDFVLALTAAEPFGAADMKVAYKLGVTDKEVAKLCDAVRKALEKGPLDPDGIRQATGNASRSLGEAGKKKGLTTTLPLALGKLQTDGEIRRVPVNGRLDQQRYRYCLWQPNPRRGFRMEAAEIAAELARRYFRWIGPATLAEFQWFSALGAKAAQAAVEPLRLETLAGEDGLMLLPEDRARWEAFRVPKQPQYALVASLDGITLLKRNTKDVIDAADLKNPLFRKKGYAGGNLADLPSHGIFDRGRLIGLWEYDLDSRSVAWASFVARGKELTAAVEETAEFVTAQLGDARSFSLDSPQSRKPRIEALRAAL
ncbi:MAG TPA: crosslink repair DNA glycosylase YcaQ family protein [Bryobacteraceae bacterium]|nr:crosslink repair DNA glycosylase YcaQ family protein [Bryobacteraceae bacterium]